MPDREVKVIVSGDDRSLERMFGRSARGAERWAGTIESAFGPRAGGAVRRFDALGTTLARNPLIDTTVTDALDALRSGLIGEAEPLRRFQVLLSEARVQQVAMRETGKSTAKSLTEQERALARTQISVELTQAQERAALAEHETNRLQRRVDELERALGRRQRISEDARLGLERLRR
jgi:hypothetical protein